MRRRPHQQFFWFINHCPSFPELPFALISLASLCCSLFYKCCFLYYFLFPTPYSLSCSPYPAQSLLLFLYWSLSSAFFANTVVLVTSALLFLLTFSQSPFLLTPSCSPFPAHLLLLILSYSPFPAPPFPAHSFPITLSHSPFPTFSCLL